MLFRVQEECPSLHMGTTLPPPCTGYLINFSLTRLNTGHIKLQRLMAPYSSSWVCRLVIQLGLGEEVTWLLQEPMGHIGSVLQVHQPSAYYSGMLS